MLNINTAIMEIISGKELAARSAIIPQSFSTKLIIFPDSAELYANPEQAQLVKIIFNLALMTRFLFLSTLAKNQRDFRINRIKVFYIGINSTGQNYDNPGFIKGKQELPRRKFKQPTNSNKFKSHNNCT